MLVTDKTKTNRSLRAVLFAVLPAALLFHGTSSAVPVPDASDQDVDSSGIYNNLGVQSYRSGDYEQAEAHFIYSLQIKMRAQGELSADMVTTYSNLGAVNRRLNNPAEAMQYYDTAAYISINHLGSDHLWLGAVYQNQANLLREQGDYARAHSYYDNALRIFSLHDQQRHIGTLYNNQGIAYERSGNIAMAKEYYLRSIEIRRQHDPLQEFIPLLNLANCYMTAGLTGEADKYYRLAEGAALDNWGSEHLHLAQCLMNYGRFLVTETDEPGRGYEKLQGALEIYRSVQGDKGQRIARTLINIGFYFEISGNPEAAIGYYQESLTANSTTFDSAGPFENPSAEDHFFSQEAAVSSLRHKAGAFYLMSGNGNSSEYLEESLSALTVATELIEKMRTVYQSEESRLALAANEHEVFMGAVHVSGDLYRLTGDKYFLEQAFMFSERSKAGGLLAAIRNIEARSFGGVPAELISREQSLSGRVAAYSELIYEEQRLPDPDSRRISLWQERRFTLENELHSLIMQLEEEYPDYYSLKYNLQVLSAGEAMEELGQRDALVSYVYNDSLVYIFAVTNRDTRFWTVPTGNIADEQLGKMMNVLSGGNLDRSVSDDFSSFKGASRYFYKLLLEPVVEFTGKRRLVIVPDGLLAYLPFELLLTSETNRQTNNYRDLPYLLRELTVSYSYSATLWQESLRKSSLSPKKVLAMAPGYEYRETAGDNTSRSRQYYRDKLVPLPGAREEAVRISELMDGRALLDDEATEENFKLLAGDYGLLHFAMHTLIDDDNPMFSKLVFSGTEEGGEDGLLNTYEIYNLELNAGLAVLSSCRSGYGAMKRGEGVMSLARGFIYAGVPSIVMTHWEIEDKSGAEIMVSFYKYLLRGYRKDEALRMARLDFLDNSDQLRAHPYFWGAYVCIGDPGRLFRSYRHLYPALTIFVLALAVVFVVWRGYLPGKKRR